MLEVVEKTFRLAVWFRIDGDMGYLSHRDTMTFWQRAIARGQLPVKYSSGFNPHMRLSLPLPKSVGMVSDNELLVIELTRNDAPEEIEASLSGQLLDGIKINRVEKVPRKAPTNPHWVEYRLQLTDRVDLKQLENQLQDFQNSDHCTVERPARGRHPRRTLEFRQQIDSLDLQADVLHFRVNIDLTGTVRVNELCGHWGLALPEDINEIRRVAVGYPSFEVVPA